MPNKLYVAENQNSTLCGKIEITRLPYNEFSDFCSGDMPSADTMYHAYQKLYNQKFCVKCGREYWLKKTDPMQSDVCGKCKKGEK